MRSVTIGTHRQKSTPENVVLGNGFRIGAGMFVLLAVGLLSSSLLTVNGATSTGATAPAIHHVASR